MNVANKLLITIAAAITLALAITNATANILSISEQNAKAEWAALTFPPGVGGDIVCPFTIEGRFHSRTIRKVGRALVGAITRAELGTCTAGRASVFKETLPWHITYEGFVGRLPEISAIRLLLARGRFRIENGTTCNVRFGPEAGGGLTGIENLNTATGQVTGMKADESRTVVLEGGFPCELASGRFAGTARFTTLATLNLIFIRLI